MRSGILRQASVSIAALVIATVVLGFGYPLAVTGISQLFFHGQANGSLVYSGGKLAGSALLGQSFTDAKGNPLPRYFQPRPSNAGAGYDGSSSGASNLGPSNPTLISDVSQRVRAYRQFNHLAPNAAVPVDAVTASGSGLDPDISPAAAEFQIARVAHSRGMKEEDVRALVERHTKGRDLGFLGEPRVNVLELNLGLDSLHPTR